MAKKKQVLEIEKEEKAPARVEFKPEPKTTVPDARTGKAAAKRVPAIGTPVQYYTADTSDPAQGGTFKTHAAIITALPEPLLVPTGQADADPALDHPKGVGLAVFVPGTGVVWKDAVPYGPGEPEHYGPVDHKD